MKTDNELIAEFMGFSRAGDSALLHYPPEGYAGNQSKLMGLKCAIDMRDVRFSTSWDWLMPVVEKITPLAKQIGQQAWFDIGYALTEANLPVVYKRTVEFIKWYNNQKP